MLPKKPLEKTIAFWRNSGDKNWKTAQSLFRLKHYDMCLFCCHLTLEKYLKALAMSINNDNPPPIHDLNRLAEIAGLNLTAEQEKQLNEISTFNIQARYDDIKLSFYKKATAHFTAQYFNVTHQLLIWLKKQFPGQ